MLKFLEFTEVIKQELEAYMRKTDSEITCSITSITKNKETEKVSIGIKGKDKRLATIVYLNEYFEMYEKGAAVSELIPKMAELYKELGVSSVLGGVNINDFNSVKEHITAKIVNEKTNQNELEAMPHLTKEGMAVIYKIMIPLDDKLQERSIKITDSLLQAWGVSTEELHGVAMDNTKRISPPAFMVVDDVLQEVITGEVPCNYFTDKETFLEKGKKEMYILTNEPKVDGAASLLHENILADIEKCLQEDFYILPSSVHEVLIVPKSISHDVGALKEMVRDINETHVLPEEVLSNEIYEYNKEEKSFKLASENPVETKGIQETKRNTKVL